ncbi:MAG: hypothetical protein MUF24_00915 [Chitinophagaceae bacterium]|jgi:hypothetical protein|nr:hypothetical protein [Chitinophagaceae bacterium]
MQHESHSNHNAPGFGKNTNGMGIFIVAIIFVVLGISTYYLWNSGNKEYEHYRIEKKAGSHSHSGHEAGEKH